MWGTWRVLGAVAAVLCASGSAGAQESASEAGAADPKPDAWARFAAARQGECVGPAGELDTPIAFSAKGHDYEILGHRMVQRDSDRGRALRIGVLSATKDDRKPTLAALRVLLRWLKRKDVDILVANGDLAENEFQLDTIFSALAASGLPVIASAGNTESCGSFNRVATRVFRKSPNFINGNWVRRIELDDATLITLPGYYDRRFAHKNSAAHYKEDDLRATKKLLVDAPGPLIFVSHGPPKMKGRAGLDIASGAGHVGDPAMTEILSKKKIRFGIFGHILEAGGRGSNLSGKKKRKKKKWYKSLYVNAGSANTDPWPMLGGRTSYGMGMMFEVKKNKARYFVKRLRPSTVYDDE